MAPTSRVRRCGLLAAVLLIAGPTGALAQQRLTCVTIGTDETVASVAQRITGDARNMRASWFQIANPTTARWVPKSRYDLPFAGWNACIVDQRQQDVPLPRLQPVAAPRRPVAPLGPVGAAAAPESRLVAPGTLFLWWAAVLVTALACWSADEYIRHRQVVLRRMKWFADRFVEEFERPLIQPHLPDRPLRSRARFTPGRSRLEIHLAPNAGLRYPNLRDHKNNVLYDLVRVQAALRDPAFVSRPPHARGDWVVVPFQLRSDPRGR